MDQFPGETPNSRGQIHTKCPFHDDRSPSFSIDIERGVFICGSPACGVRGNFPMFYKLREGITKWSEVFDAIKVTHVASDLMALLEKSGGSLKVAYQLNAFPAPDDVQPVGSVKYLVDRGLGHDITTLYGIMYGVFGEYSKLYIQDTLVLPIYDLDGEYCTFQVRYLNPNKRLRWQSPAGSPLQLLLYGGWLITGGYKELWVVEGASDVWNLRKLGLQAVGLFTKEATDGQLNRIRDLCDRFGLTPIICLDGDAVVHKNDGSVLDYGQKIYDEVSAYGISAVLAHLKGDEDPGELTPDRLYELRKSTEGLIAC